jgi:nitrate/nitrite transporter NarK
LWFCYAASGMSDWAIKLNAAGMVGALQGANWVCYLEPVAYTARHWQADNLVFLVIFLIEVHIKSGLQKLPTPSQKNQGPACEEPKKKGRNYRRFILYVFYWLTFGYWHEGRYDGLDM